MRILIIEDEARIAKRIERFCQEVLGNKLKQIINCTSVNEGQYFIENHPIDVLILDLNLRGEDGFEVLKHAVSGAFHTIIISAYTERAIEAFKYGVLDFIPKPFNKDRLTAALTKLGLSKNQLGNHLKYLAVKKKGRVHLIHLDELLFIKGASIYTELHLKNGQREFYDKSLEKLEQLLPEHFERIHRSYLVDMNEVNEIIIQSGTKYRLSLTNGIILPIGRSRYKHLKDKWIL